MPLIEPVRVGGLDTFGSKIRGAKTATARQMTDVEGDAAGLVLSGARRLVPKGPSGAARASLGIIRGQVTGGGRKASYYGWLEFGGRVGIDGSVQRRFVPGGRYIWPAWQKNRTQILTLMEDAVSDAATDAGLEVT